MESLNNDRSNGLGGSDIPSVLGLSPYKTKYELFLEKQTKTKEEISEEMENRFEIGHLLEDFVISRFERNEVVKVTDRQKRLIHPKHDFLWGTIDGMCDNDVLEVKTTLSFNKCWKYGVPTYVIAQGLYYAHLADASGFKVVVFFRDRD